MGNALAAKRQKVHPTRVLIVDDIAEIRKLLREFLEEEPEFIVCGEAVDGSDAIEQARELRPDLIILDASMPVLNGIQAAPLLKKLLPSALIILFTAHEFMMGGLHATEMGVDAVVSKDRGMAALGESINTLLHTKP
jgi:DNA-binding NarL/FixJ family response regulator